MKFQDRKQFFTGIVRLAIKCGFFKQQAYVFVDIIKVDNLDRSDIIYLRRTLSRKSSKIRHLLYIYFVYIKNYYSTSVVSESLKLQIAQPCY